jgi:hypothetical protein
MSMIVGLGHNMGVGKDTAALALSRDLGFRKLAFADPLRDLAMHADPLITSNTRTVNVDVGHGRLGWAIKGLGYEAAKRTYPEVRAFLQRLGYGARQVFGENFWTDQTMAKVAKHVAGGGAAVISDVRFLNEAPTIKEAGGLLIKITRPGHNGDGHVSETELAEYDGWDLVIENTGSVVELEAAIVREVRDRMPKEEAA